MNIDMDWLESVRAEFVDGTKIVGIAGVGAEKVQFKLQVPDGSLVVLGVEKQNIGFLIREIPPFFLVKPEYKYDIGAVNSKLRGLVGRPWLDQYCLELHKVFSSLVYELYENGIVELKAKVSGTPCEGAVLDLLMSQPLKRRLEHLAAISDPVDGEYSPLWVNKPFEIMDTGSCIRRWAQQILSDLSLDTAQPEPLASNPLIVWGSAVMYGFFTDDEMREVVSFIRHEFGEIPSHRKITSWVAQAGMIADYHANWFTESDSRDAVVRFVRFCALCGVVLQVSDFEGNIIADGSEFLFDR